MKKFAVIAILLLSCSGWGQNPTITVDASAGTTIHTRFGHNTEFFQNAREMWNPLTKQVKQLAKDAMQVAGISNGGLVRCFGGVVVYSYAYCSKPKGETPSLMDGLRTGLFAQPDSPPAMGWK
jgi:hypothetical protein